MRLIGASGEIEERDSVEAINRGAAPPASSSSSPAGALPSAPTSI